METVTFNQRWGRRFLLGTLTSSFWKKLACCFQLSWYKARFQNNKLGLCPSFQYNGSKHSVCCVQHLREKSEPLHCVYTISLHVSCNSEDYTGIVFLYGMNQPTEGSSNKEIGNRPTYWTVRSWNCFRRKTFLFSPKRPYQVWGSAGLLFNRYRVYLTGS